MNIEYSHSFYRNLILHAVAFSFVGRLSNEMSVFLNWRLSNAIDTYCVNICERENEVIESNRPGVFNSSSPININESISVEKKGNKLPVSVLTYVFRIISNSNLRVCVHYSMAYQNDMSGN